MIPSSRYPRWPCGSTESFSGHKDSMDHMSCQDVWQFSSFLFPLYLNHGVDVGLKIVGYYCILTANYMRRKCFGVTNFAYYIE